MARMSLSQLKSKIRQIESQQKQATNRFNQQVRKVQQAVRNYNSAVQNYNSRLRTYQRSLKTEQTRIQTQRTTIRYSILRTSSLSLNSAYLQLDSDEAQITKTPRGAWFLDSSERETANSLRVTNFLEDSDTKTQSEEDEFSDDALMKNQIKGKIETFSSDLAQRWGGALYSLNPRNPDASRHFCTSAREIFVRILDTKAPDEIILSKFPECPKTDTGKPTRREKIKYILTGSGISTTSAVEFYEMNINNIMQLFKDFNEGTHGNSGVFKLHQLVAIKKRVEDGLDFLLDL